MALPTMAIARAPIIALMATPPWVYPGVLSYHQTLLPPPHSQVINSVFKQIDATTDFKHLHEFECHKTQHNQLKTEYQVMKQESEANRRKGLAREKQLQAREAATAAREANQNERDEQITLLKAHFNQLELKVTDLKEQNKLFKLNCSPVRI